MLKYDTGGSWRWGMGLTDMDMDMDIDHGWAFFLLFFSYIGWFSDWVVSF